MMPLHRLACLALALLAAVLASAGPAQAAALVVAEARGVALKPGQIIDDAQKLTLLAGQRVTLIAVNGATLRLNGPYDEAPAASNPGAVDWQQALGTLVEAGAPRNGDVGLVRNASDIVDLPDPWLLEVDRPGNVCWREGATAVFWHPAAANVLPLAITPADRSWRAVASWPGGSDRIAVPGTVPLRDRATYIITLADRQAAVTINAVPTTLSSDEMRAGWLIEKGCLAQARALLRGRL
jgi:hypothetical protein